MNNGSLHVVHQIISGNSLSTMKFSTAFTSFSIVLINFLPSCGTKGESIRRRDPYIVCSEGFVPDNAHGLPQGYSPLDYYNLMQLCSALNGNTRNVGCACTSSHESSFHCYPGIADLNLFRAVDSYSLKPFPLFCKESCSCTDSESATLNQSQQDDARHYRGADPMNSGGSNYFDSNDASYQIHQPGDEIEGGYRQVPGDQGNGYNLELNKDPAPAVTISHGQCWKNCTSNADCLKDGGTGCMCSTQSEQYQPGSGTVAFVAACIISMSGVGWKRQDTNPCPCNATYVSYACCGVAGGLVWEAKQFKLGELVNEQGV